MIIQFLVNGIIIGSIYAVLALGFSLVYNTTKIFHIAYAVLFMVAGYFFFTFYNLMELPLIPSALLAIIVTIFISVLIEILVYKPLKKRKASNEVFLISSLGVMIIGINIIALFYGNETKIISNEIAKSVKWNEIIITYPQLYQFIISILSILLFMVLVKYTRFGITIRALKDDDELAEVFGLNISTTRIKLFALSGFFAALAGVLMAYDIGFDPYVGLPMFLYAVVALIIGGVNRFSSPVVGGVLLGIVQAVVIWKFSANWQEAITFLLLIIFLLFRPQGILGTKTRKV